MSSILFIPPILSCFKNWTCSEGRLAFGDENTISGGALQYFRGLDIRLSRFSSAYSKTPTHTATDVK